MLAGGAESPWMKFALVALVLTGAGITGVLSRRERRSADHRYSDTLTRPNPAARADDPEIAKQVDELLRGRAIPWIRTEDFVMPWRDDRIAPFRELVHLMDGHPSIADLQLDIALENLTEVTRIFLTTYDASTMTDPLFQEDTWRLAREEILPPGSRVDDGWGDAAILRHDAARIVDAYAQVQRASRGILPAV